METLPKGPSELVPFTRRNTENDVCGHPKVFSKSLKWDSDRFIPVVK